MNISLECQSCKDDRHKKGLPSVKKVKLPEAITAKSFRHPKIPVWVCPYCCPPETPIWMGEGFKALGDIQIGDSIIGWTENTDDLNVRVKQTTRLCKTEVIDVFERHTSVIRVHMESGRELICTPDHLWAGYNEWAPPRFTPPVVGRHLRHVIDVPDLQTIDAYAAGYIAAIYDGEGGDLRMHQCPEHNPETFARIGEMLDRIGISYTKSLDSHASSVQGDFTLTGGRQGYLDFLFKTRPAKSESLLKHILTSRFATKDRIMAIEPWGESDVVSMKTSTGNYIAWGYQSRNCDGETLITGALRNFRNGDS